MKLEYAAHRDLLNAYLKTNYPGQGVLVVYIDDVLETKTEHRERIMTALAEYLGGEIPSRMLLFGYLFITMRDLDATRFMCDFNKAPFRLEYYVDGVCINENR